METRTTGLAILALGLLLALVGALVWLGAFRWFGHLPGDLRIVGERTRLFVPLTSMLIVSLVLTLLVNLFQRLF